jgi:RNA polymerase sigma-70 factor (ECF subfamily)
MSAEALQGSRAAGRTATFASFYERERPSLYRALALTLGDADLAADAVDEGMARAYARWHRIEQYDSPAGWVYRVARNWAVSRLRRYRRTVLVSEVRDDVGREDPSPADEALAAALAALPAGQRAVVVLRFQLDWPVEQVAAALGVAPGTVKSRLHRGLATLRERLADGR